MIFNTNQNRQFYAFNEVVTVTPTKEGQIQLCKADSGKQIFFKHYGKGGLTRSDLIDVAKVSYAKMTPKADMQRKLKTATVTLDSNVNSGNPISGQDYILRIQVKNYLAPGDANVLIRSAAVHATKGMTPDQFYTKMHKSLEMNFKRDPQALLKFELVKSTDATPKAIGIKITEVEQPWRHGVLSQEPVNFEAIPTEVRFDGEDVTWGETAYADSTVAVGNGKQIADLEYFCMAERGDMFRNMGWPHNIDVKYMVDPTKEYDVLDIHYAYSGDGVQVHKSEKDITLVTSAAVMNTLKTSLTSAGVTVG